MDVNTTKMSKPCDDYDVFLNHRGPDVKGTFVAHLEDALSCAGFHSFLDKKSLRKGDPAFISIDQALQASDVHVAIVSRRYAESKYCLNELVAMWKSGKPIIPVFYDVEPQHLRHELLSGPFGAAFEKHKKKKREKEVKEWVHALEKLAQITGFRLADYKEDEAKLKHEIVKEVQRLLPSNRPLEVGKYRVGLRSSFICCVQKLENMGPNTGLLSLVGMGGVGKSTLSQEIYNHFAGIKKYQHMAFLRDIRSTFSETQVGRKGQVELQNQLLWDLLRVKETSRDYNFWFHKLSSRGPVFIVLDNIDSKEQFEQFIPDMNLLGEGSRVILTSRDKRLSTVFPREIPTYQHVVVPLESSASQRLFNWHAFGSETTPKEFQVLAKDVASACHGLPLALKVVGSSLIGKTTIQDRETIWLEAIQYLKENADVLRVLQWSFDCLPSKSEKVMFLDIACIIHGIEKKCAVACWEACKYCTSCSGFRTPHSSLQCLIDRCLVEEYSRAANLIVHDLLQDMAKDIVRRQSDDPRRHSHQFEVRVGEQLVAKNKGTKYTRGLTLAGSRKRKFSTENIGKMKRLHFLVLDDCHVTGNFKRFPRSLRFLQWRSMPFTQIPPGLDLSGLSMLDLSRSNDLTELWSNSNPPMQHCPLLRTLKMESCYSITELPESIGALSKLEQMDLRDCRNLRNLPESIGQLKELRSLQLSRCNSLVVLPSSIGALTRLENISMMECKQLTSLPDSLGHLCSLRKLNVTGALITELPRSLGHLSKLESLDLSNCSDLRSLPDTLCNLTALFELELSTTSIREIPQSLGHLLNLEYLGFDGCDLEVSPKSFCGNPRLKILRLLGNGVECLSEIVGYLPDLEEIYLDEDPTDVPEGFMTETTITSGAEHQLTPRSPPIRQRRSVEDLPQQAEANKLQLGFGNKFKRTDSLREAIEPIQAGSKTAKRLTDGEEVSKEWAGLVIVDIVASSVSACVDIVEDLWADDHLYL